MPRGLWRISNERAKRIGRVLFGVVYAPIVWLVVAAAMTKLPVELTSHGSYSESVRYLDRDGALLREVRAEDATRARWVSLDEVGELAARAVLAAEDARFYEHAGVDPLAVLRAVGQSVWNRRVVSGASTLTMQLARLVRPHRRNIFGKLGEMALALRIEASLSKREVLEQYVNRAPFGSGLRGLDAASRYYFDKPPAELSLAEAASLAGIPRGPAVYSMAKHPERVVRRRDRILDRMAAHRWITDDEAARAKAEPLTVRIGKGSFGAPHFVQALHGGAFGGAPSAVRGVVVTTVRRDLQREAETSAAATIKSLASRHVTAASAVVLSNATGEILAYVGSHDFTDAAHGGQNDGVLAKRQPGSTLKPFVYGLAMEKLGLTAASIVPDIELHLAVAAGGVYAPMNYDERFHGPVRVRDALANSYNVPAVWTADRVGVPLLLDRLHALGFAKLVETPEYYGPGLALGDGEVTLLELANAYATIARDGVYIPVRAVRGGGESPSVRVMPVAVARVLADILADKKARVASFGERSALELGFRVAAKTGTSKGYRDNWTIGFTRDVTVGVWVGNFDGTPMEGVSGITGAAPLFRAVMEAAMRGKEPDAIGFADDADAEDTVEGEICPLSGGRPTSACTHRIRERLSPGEWQRLDACTMHVRVRVDRRNGLRAGDGCPAAFVFDKTFERFEGELAAWAKEAKRDVAPEAYSPLCPDRGGTSVRTDDGRALRIGYPHDGARFLLDPDRPRDAQVLAVRVDAPGEVSRVSVRVDGRVVASVGPPFVAEWRLAPGDHVLIAEARGRAPSETVRVRVE